MGTLHVEEQVREWSSRSNRKGSGNMCSTRVLEELTRGAGTIIHTKQKSTVNEWRRQYCNIVNTTNEGNEVRRVAIDHSSINREVVLGVKRRDTRED